MKLPNGNFNFNTHNIFFSNLLACGKATFIDDIKRHVEEHDIILIRSHKAHARHRYMIEQRDPRLNFLYGFAVFGHFEGFCSQFCYSIQLFLH